MLKCKRCHAPDELNGIGLCKHCTAFIKNDVKENKDRLARIYDQFPEGFQALDDAQKADYLQETKDIFDLLDRYHRMGFPVGSYVMPVRKILHFLDPGGDLERQILIKQRRRAGVTAALCAAMAAAFAIVVAVLGSQPLPVKLGDAVSVSASVDGHMDDAGMEAAAEAGSSDSEDAMEGSADGESGGGEASADGEEESADAPDEEASGETETAGEEDAGDAPDTAQAAPPVSVRASGGTAVIGGGRAIAIPVG